MSDNKKTRLHWWLAGASVLGIALLPAGRAEAQDASSAEAHKPFEFHGYLRSGFGINERGGDQDAFHAPGAYAKYRLGNEAETYGEATFVANWLNPESDGAWFKTHLTLALVAPRNSTFDTLDAFAVREAFAEAGRVIEAAPEMTVWAGQRFYRRHDVHINDFFYWDMSGYGAGFQDLDVGIGKLAVAYLGGSNDAFLPDVGRFTKNNIDIRLYGIDVGTGSLTLWLNPVVARGDADGLVQPSSHGFAGGIAHTLGGFMGGFNELSVQFGYGGGANLSTFIGGADNGWMLRVVERATIQPNDKLSLMWGGVFQLDNTDGNEGPNMWISAGARPIYHFGKYTALAVEGGIDLVQPDEGELGMLTKLTVAPEIRPGSSFWARPAIRAFATAAFWNNPIAATAGNPDGGVGGAAYVDKNFGMTFGVQMESWW